MLGLQGRGLYRSEAMRQWKSGEWDGALRLSGAVLRTSVEKPEHRFSHLPLHSETGASAPLFRGNAPAA